MKRSTGSTAFQTLGTPEGIKSVFLPEEGKDNMAEKAVLSGALGAVMDGLDEGGRGKVQSYWDTLMGRSNRKPGDLSNKDFVEIYNLIRPFVDHRRK